MNKSYRIKTEVGTNADKHIKLKLDQEIDTFEILSLSINQKDVYQNFNCDYGVLIGRVNANGAVGIPNAKISIFIPITDEDKENPKIKAVYPYETPKQKNVEGKRYNLLPRVSQLQVDGTVRPKQPFGTFPIKEEFVTNETLLEVYEKYYKYTTVTNQSGDYMIYGVPVGLQTVHMSVDVTDIGKFSMNPASMVTNLGYSANLFSDNTSKIKPSSDLDDLVNIETQEISVEVIPFCGDSDTFDIGITRQDFRMRAELISTFTLFGSAFTDAFRATWGQNDIESGDKLREMWRINNNANENVSISTKRNGKIVLDVWYYPSTVSDADIDSGNVDTTNDIIQLTPDEYTSFIEDGEFVVIMNCNRKKIVTNEQGEEEVVPNNNANGVFTQFRGMVFCEYAPELDVAEYGDIDGGKFNDHTYRGQRWRVKIPQSANDGESFNKENSGVKEEYNEEWRKQSYLFEGNKFYSVAKFHNLDSRNGNDDRHFNTLDIDPFWNTGIIITSSNGSFPDDNPTFEFPHNNSGTNTQFGAEWLNFCLHFPQHTYFIRKNNDDTHSNSSPTIDYLSYHPYNDNSQKIVGSKLNTKWYLRSDRHQTNFIEVPLGDIINIVNQTNSNDTPKGFASNQAPYDSEPLSTNNYEGTGSIKYFFKGFDEADCFVLLESLNLI